MPSSERPEIDLTAPPFDRLKAVRPLATTRSGRSSAGHGRHLLYVGSDSRSRMPVLVKVTSKPGLIYERNLANEIDSLTTINRELLDAPYFPTIRDSGRLRDGRVFLVMSLFEEFPLATTIGTEYVPARLVGHLRTAIEVATALGQLHQLEIFHVDLNPMNILYRTERGAPLIRIVDFESSYERRRHARGAFYDPPTTSGYTAPEIPDRAPDARSDVYSLAAVLYTMLEGYGWTWTGAVASSIGASPNIDAEFRAILLSAAANDPDQRCPSMDLFRAALSGYLESIWPGRTR